MSKVATILATILVLTGCSHSRQVARKSNLMAYLYPGEVASPRDGGSEVKLQLPLRIGVAFVPADTSPSPRLYGGYGDLLMPADGENRLVNIVRKSFQGRDWVSEIITIPSNYLMPAGGFDNLSQIAQLMNVDVIALVSVDQLQHSDPTRMSFLYVSIIGAYVLPLDRNETRTLIDAAVFHVPSRTFLLRAPGVNKITGNSTAVDVTSSLRERSLRSFELAMTDLSKNLDAEVADFKASVASGERKSVDIYTAQGKSVRGGGAFGVWETALSMLLALLAVAGRKP